VSRGRAGASLVGLLLIVVVLGALTATAVVAVSTLNSNDNKSVISQTIGPGTVGTGRAGGSGAGNTNRVSTENACRASADAARSASAVYFADNGGSYPAQWSDLTASNPPMFALAANVAINATNPKELDGRGWKLTLAGGGTSEAVFTCS